MRTQKEMFKIHLITIEMILSFKYANPKVPFMPLGILRIMLKELPAYQCVLQRFKINLILGVLNFKPA